LFAELGQERGPPLLERGDLSPVLFQLAVDLLQLGPRLPFPEVPLTMPAADQILDLTAEQPQLRVSVHRSRPVLQLARADRRDDLVLCKPELRPSRLVAQRRALATPFIAVQLHNRSLSTRAAPASPRSRVYRRPPEASSNRRYAARPMLEYVRYSRSSSRFTRMIASPSRPRISRIPPPGRAS
jgi:hypothetical protein